MTGRRSLALAVALLGIASIVSLAFAARLVPLGDVAAAVRTVRPLPAAVVVCVFALNHAVRTLRYRVLLPAVPLGRVVSPELGPCSAVTRRAA